MQVEIELKSCKNSYQSCSKNSQIYSADYCTNTSIHGLKFLGEKGRSVVERIWWLLFLGVSLYFCVALILEAYQKWELFPVVVSFATTETAVFRIPFPAVSVCPQIKSQKSLVDFTNLALKKRNRVALNETESKEFAYMSLVCSLRWGLLQEQNRDPIINDESFIDFLMKVQPNFYKTVEDCFWLEKNCSEDIAKIFTPTLTKDGICFSYNLLDRDEIFSNEVRNAFYERFLIPRQPRSEWSLEGGYDDNSDFDAFPRRTLVGGIAGGLDLTFYTRTSDLDHLCGDGLQGYKIVLHNPIQMPNPNQRYFRIGLNQDVSVAVKPNIMTTSKQLTNYSPLQRKCLFANEMKLRFFKVYDQQNCLHECLSNFTNKHCGCVGFFMLHDNSTLVCGPGKHSCVEEASCKYFIHRTVHNLHKYPNILWNEKYLWLLTALFLASEIKFRIRNKLDQPISRHRIPKDILKNCNCIPSCNSLDFEAEISQSDWNWKEGAKILINDRPDLINAIHLSRLRVFFRDMQFITSERNELYGKMDFFSSCGGLLGLFIGFSFISAVEIVYYISLRPFCNFRKYGRSYWSGGDLANVKEYV